MKALLLEPVLILLILGAVVHTAPPPSTASPTDTNKVSPGSALDYQYEDYGYDDDEHDEIKFSEDKPCPRDCTCPASTNARIAHCSRLEVGTQKFGDDITGIVIENVDKKHPLVLTGMIFRQLGLHQITNVKISNSVIASISPLAFKGLHELYSVNLTGNSIQKIDPEIFAFNNKLSLVDLSDNPLTIDPNTPFLNSSSIQELEIARCGLKYISKNALTKLTNLMYINLSGNKLQELDRAVFSKLRILEEVDVSENSLESIPEDLFMDNSEMTTLRVRGNPITSVIDVQIKELLTIDLSMAKISTIGPSMFNGMPLVSNLNLSGNGIRTIHNQAFHELTSLNYLDLSNNNLDLISDQLIKENVQLDILKIARNPFLKSLPEEGFACSSEQFNIYLFDASGCSIEKISDNFLKTMPALSLILLSHNKIKSIGSALQKSTRLVEIDLSYNSLTILAKDAFSMNQDLGKLNLAGNPLTILSADLFVSNTILTWLDVSSCHLNSLWETNGVSSGLIMKNLHFLNASNNNIKSVNYKQLQTISKLFTLDISQNPLECNTEFQTLMTWLGDHNVLPSATDMLSSPMVVDKKVGDIRKKWEFLSKAVCPTNIMPVSSEHSESESDEKAGVESILKKIEENPLIDINGEYIVDEYEDDYDDENGDDILSVPYKEPKVKTKDSEVKIPDDLPKIYKNIDHNKIEIPFEKEINEESSIAKEMFDELEEERRMGGERYVTYLELDYDYKQYVLPTLLTIICSVFLVFLVMKAIKYCSGPRNIGYKSAVLNIHTPSVGRGKKDCGLVYQPLSEDLSGPKTPIISRQFLGASQPSKGTDISYKSSPFHHSNITPEHV